MMSKRFLTILSFVLSLLLFVGALSSCGLFGNEEETSAPDSSEATTDTSPTDSTVTQENETTNTVTDSTESSGNTNETASTEPAGTEPVGTEPVGTEPVGTEPENTDPAGTESEGTEPAGTETTAPATEPEMETIPPEEQVTLPEESDSTQETTVPSSDMDVIDLSNKLTNGSYPYYTDTSRNELLITNNVMDLGYRVTNALGDMTVSHLSTKDGHAYIKDTMDIFVRMKDGSTFYAGKSSNSQATLNIYRYGYYFYENRLEGQTFVNSQGKINEVALSPTLSLSSCHDIEFVGQMKNEEDKSYGFKYKVTGGDPYVVLRGINFDTAKYDTLQVTIKAPDATQASEVYIIAGGAGGFSSTQVKSFGLINDGEAHTYQIPLSGISNYNGKLTGLRLDINCAVGTTVEVSDLSLFKLDISGSPSDLKLQRSFLTYSNKLHHLFQVSTFKDVENIQVFGMETKIEASTVAKYVIKDRNGLHYNTLEKIHWSSVEYVGFDIKDAGIFGLILPYDGSGGTLKVSFSDGYYIVEQTKGIAGGVLSPSCYYNPELPAQSGRYEVIKANNGNDFFLGQRIYTDTFHTFEKFIIEAECEVNPLTSDNIVVDTEKSDGASFAGYDPLFGYYKFKVAGIGFNPPYYKYPNKHYSVVFSVVGDQYDRQAYFMSQATSSGCLECAVLLDKDGMLLPVPIEVAKNFVGDGENNIFNNEDRAYGEAYFPMIINAYESRSYTIVNLYQNWGNVPLKQLSSIQFHTPYYHLSTGVTETNCIVPYNVAGPGLPDFRGMSAPHWESQPQHNSGGGHSFLVYNDANGGYQPSDTVGVEITAYGPTYAEIDLDYISADGKIKATYTHMEMPQTDENRSYYTMKYTVLEDVEIKDFKNNFKFYYCTDNSGTGTYQKVGYLDENNQYQVADAVNEANYVLGDECPYFSFFMMPDWDRESPHVEGYTNLAFLIYNYEFIINGEKVDTNFYLRNRGASLSLSLNLDDVTLKAGDTFCINAILMPWGSQELEDDPANRLNKPHATGYTEYTYSTVLPDGTLYMDKNVRDVRENTLLNPLTATAIKDCEVLESVYLPKLKTTNGETAEFTISGGHNNSTVRVYGYNMLTVPKLEEYNKETGEWVIYELNSINHPDNYGYGHYYDGYAVHYDEDGTFSYSFVIPMDNGAPRTFRLSANEKFEGWPEIPPDTSVIDDPINYFLQPSEVMKMTATASHISGADIMPDRSFVSLFGYSNNAETQMTFFGNDTEAPQITGQYVVIKYRLPKGISTFSGFEMFASSTTASPDGVGDRIEFKAQIDDQWHVVIVDLSTLPEVEPDENGNYLLNFCRWDILNGKVSSEMYIDIAYVGLHDDIKEICDIETNKEVVTTETPKYIDLIVGSTTTKIDPYTGEVYVPTYIDPSNEQGYKLSTVEYAAWIDYVNRTSNSFGMHNNKAVPEYANPTKKTIGEGLLVLTGWVLAEGGIEKYVWSADGGKTWHDTVMYNGYSLQGAGSDTIAAYSDIKKYTDENGNTVKPTLKDTAAAQINGGFRGYSGICANLADYYADGTVVSVTFAAVPKADTSSLCILGHITNVEVYVEPPIEPSETVNLPLTPEQIYNKVTASSSNYTFDSATLSVDKSIIRFNAKADKGDQYGLVMNGNTQHTGQYLFFKYRIPKGAEYSTLNTIEIFTSTVNAHFTGGDNFSISVVQDGEWHVVIVDVSKKLSATKFGKNGDGRYVAKYLRVDVFNEKVGAGMYAEFSAMGFADNLDVIYEEFCSDMEYVTVVGSSTDKIDPSTGSAYVPSYVHKDSGYTVSDVDHYIWIDAINKVSHSFGVTNGQKVVEKASTTTKTIREGLVVLTGWAVVEGGVDKYVWSADGGKTWHDTVMYNGHTLQNADEAMFKTFKWRKGYSTFAGPGHIEGEETVVTALDPNVNYKKNGGFHGGSGICANLADYFAEGDVVNVTFAAVPSSAPNTLIVIGHVTNNEVYVEPTFKPSETVNLPLTPEQIYNKVTETSSNYTFDSASLSEDKSIIRLNAKADKGDQYGLMMNGNTQPTGQYVFLKYRIPNGSTCSTLTAMQIFTSTVNPHFTGSGDNFTFSVIQDGEWHVLIIDVSQKLKSSVFGKNSDGKYVAKYLRVDVFEQTAKEGMYAEFSAMGFADNLDVIYKEFCSDMKYVTVIGSSTAKIDPSTGETYVKTYIDPTNEQGYTKSSVEFAGYIDMVNGMGANRGTNKSLRVGFNHTTSVYEFSDHCGTTLEGTQKITFSGWLVLNGGVEKYVWSADGGKTWHDVEFHIQQGFTNGSDAHLNQLTATGAVVTDKNATLKNACFQGGEGGGASTAGLAANLKDYAGQKVDVTFAAVPKNDPNGLCILLDVVGVQVPVLE